MSGFYYYLPEDKSKVAGNDGRLNKTVLTAYGLHGVFGDETKIADHVMLEKCGGDNVKPPGTCIYFKPVGEKRPQFGFHRPEQKWTKWGEYFVGYDPEAPPTQQDLVRQPDMLHYLYTMSDGWLIATITTPEDRRSCLPGDVTFTPDGQVVISPKRQYDHYWQLMGELFDELQENNNLPRDMACRAAVDILQINYRIGQAEVTIMSQQLGISVADTDRAAAICMLAIGWDPSAWKKKQEPASNSQPATVSG